MGVFSDCTRCLEYAINKGGDITLNVDIALETLSYFVDNDILTIVIEQMIEIYTDNNELKEYLILQLKILENNLV